MLNSECDPVTFECDHVVTVTSREVSWTNLPLVAFEECSVGHRVEERPKASVAASIVVVFEQLFIQSYRKYLSIILTQYASDENIFKKLLLPTGVADTKGFYGLL